MKMPDEKTVNKVHELGYQLLGWFDTICRKYDIQYFLSDGALLGSVRNKGFIPWDADIDVWMTRAEYAKFVKHLDELPEDYEFFLPDSYGHNRYYDLVPKLSCKRMRAALSPGCYEYYNCHFPNSMHLDIFFIEKTYSGWRSARQAFEMAFLCGLMNSYRHKSIMDRYPLHWRICQSILSRIVVGAGIQLEDLFRLANKVSTRYNSRDDADGFFVSNEGLYLGKVYPARCLTRIKYVPFGPLEVPAPEGTDEILKIRYGNYWELPPEEDRVFPDGIVFT